MNDTDIPPVDLNSIPGAQLPNPIFVRSKHAPERAGFVKDLEAWLNLFDWCVERRIVVERNQVSARQIRAWLEADGIVEFRSGTAYIAQQILARHIPKEEGQP